MENLNIFEIKKNVLCTSVRPTTFTCLTTKWRTDEFSNSSFLKFVFKINFSSVFGRKLPKFQNNAY